MNEEDAERLIELFKDWIRSIIANESSEHIGDYLRESEFRSELTQRIVTITGGVMGKPENVLCPDCNGAMKPREGKYGKFWGCANYPNCKGTRDSMGRSKAEREAETSNSPKDREDTARAYEQSPENHSGFSWNKK